MTGLHLLDQKAVLLGVLQRLRDPDMRIRVWYTKTETATRLRGRIERVLDYARVRRFREGENPALWRGNLSHALPAKSDIMKVEHMAAMPYSEIPDFWKGLDAHTGTAVEALRFTILTAARSGETRGMTWDEIDLEQKIWTIPSGRMKAGEEHRIPLSPAAVAILEKMHKQRRGDFVFPGMKKDRPLSDASMLKVLKLMGLKGKVTTHGFRSSFRDWAAEQTDTPREVAEIALAHKLASDVEAAYWRSDLIDKRRPLMEEWAAYCTGQSV